MPSSAKKTSSPSPNQAIQSQNLSPDIPNLLSTELFSFWSDTESQAALTFLFTDKETEAERT